MSSDPWQTDRLDLAGYLDRLAIPARVPSPEALAELHEAHVRTFTFDNIDVLLGRHPGVSLDAVQEKFVGRGRGGYCFEHSTLLAAALERLGYQVRRHLGRVGDPAAGAQQGRTHMVVEVLLDGRRMLCDPGFGMSLLRPIAMADGAEDDYLPGWRYRLRRTDAGDWVLHRRREDAWEVAHTTDELEVKPADVVIGHHFTSTFPGSHFTTGLILTKHLPGRHVTLTHEALTVRTPGEPTEHRPLRDGEIEEWLTTMEVPLTPDERARLLTRLAALSASGASVVQAQDSGPFFHGTKADLRPGDQLGPGQSSNYGERRRANFVYLTATLDAATWGAELAAGDGPGRIYVVEPTGAFEDDPNLTDQKFPGNPTRSYRTRDPLRIVEEVTDWEGHSPDVLQAMRDHLDELKRAGVEAIND